MEALPLVFFIYAFLGWCGEVAFAAIKEGAFVNRGFLNGPVCPIYGFGVFGVVTALRPVQDNLWLLYLGSAALTTALEFVTGWVLEKIFHTRWWDYSDTPMSIMGYVCIPFSLLWGVACVVIVKLIHPMFLSMADRLLLWMCVSLDALFALTFMLDLVATVIAVHKLSDRLSCITAAAGELHAISDDIAYGIYDTTTAACEKTKAGAGAVRSRQAAAWTQIEARLSAIEKWLGEHRQQADAAAASIRRRFDTARSRARRALNEKSYIQRRLVEAFPTMKSLRYQESLEILRRFYKRSE